MKLTYKNYTAKSNGDRFDLTETRKVTADRDTETRKKGRVYETEVRIGYGYTYDGLCRKIAALELDKQQRNIELGKYPEEFRGILNLIWAERGFKNKA